MAVALLVFSSTRPAAAQAAAEYGTSATGSSGTAGISTSIAGSANKLDSALSHEMNSSVSTASSQPTVAPEPWKGSVEGNRRTLEQNAGQNAAKLSLKSLPVKAVVKINGKPVGRTPLQLSLAPGTYKIEMQGSRMEAGRQQVDLSPKETREIELQLSPPRYRSYVTLQ